MPVAHSTYTFDIVSKENVHQGDTGVFQYDEYDMQGTLGSLLGCITISRSNAANMSTCRLPDYSTAATWTPNRWQLQTLNNATRRALLAM